MNNSTVSQFLITHSGDFPREKMPFIKERLEKLEDPNDVLVYTSFKTPVISLILSLFLGYLGIDRLYVGDIGLGILKLITCGGLGIWTIIDWFLIMKVTRRKNYEKLAILM